MDLNTLMLRVAAGEEGAMSQLIESAGGLVRCVCEKVGLPESDVEDIFQEVFISVWRHAARFDPSKGRASTWIYRIAVNQVSEHLRRNRVRSGIKASSLTVDIADNKQQEEQHKEAAVDALARVLRVQNAPVRCLQKALDNLHSRKSKLGLDDSDLRRFRHFSGWIRKNRPELRHV